MSDEPFKDERIFIQPPNHVSLIDRRQLESMQNELSDLRSKLAEAQRETDKQRKYANDFEMSMEKYHVEAIDLREKLLASEVACADLRKSILLERERSDILEIKKDRFKEKLKASKAEAAQMREVFININKDRAFPSLKKVFPFLEEDIHNILSSTAGADILREMEELKEKNRLLSATYIPTDRLISMHDEIVDKRKTIEALKEKLKVANDLAEAVRLLASGTYDSTIKRDRERNLDSKLYLYDQALLNEPSSKDSVGGKEEK